MIWKPNKKANDGKVSGVTQYSLHNSGVTARTKIIKLKHSY